MPLFASSIYVVVFLVTVKIWEGQILALSVGREFIIGTYRCWVLHIFFDRQRIKFPVGIDKVQPATEHSC